MSLTVAVAQLQSTIGDLTGTVADHVAQIREAAAGGASVVVFPELSLTGYDPELIDLQTLRIGPDDLLVQPLRRVCRELRIQAFVGAPVAPADPEAFLPEIGVLSIDASGTARHAYSKQHLAVGEIGLFSAGRRPGRLTLGGLRTSLAVCADAATPEHPQQEAAAGAQVYLLGALYLMGAENRITEQMARITGLGMWAVLAQHSGGTGIGPACGGSGIWSPDGRVVARLGTGPGVAVATVG